MNTSEMLSKIHTVLDTLLAPGTSCALLDFPNHANVGDSAIWLGEIDYLSNRKVTIRYSCDAANYNRKVLEYCHPDGPILISGGGNIGDLWLNHQRLREQVLRNFPNRKVIQLPQSIHFQSPAKLSAARSVFNNHSDLTLLVRDHKSFAFAQKVFDCKVLLCPDMAFAMRPERVHAANAPCARGEVGSGAVYLSRTDIEASGQKRKDVFFSGLEMTDWLKESPPKAALWYQFCHRMERPELMLLCQLMQRARLLPANNMASERLSRGLTILARGEKVVSDRLHGIILAILLGRRVYAFDNSYGKLSSFLFTWKKHLPPLEFFENEDSAIKAACS